MFISCTVTNMLQGENTFAIKLLPTRSMGFLSNLFMISLKRHAVVCINVYFGGFEHHRPSSIEFNLLRELSRGINSTTCLEKYYFLYVFWGELTL